MGRKLGFNPIFDKNADYTEENLLFLLKCNPRYHLSFSCFFLFPVISKDTTYTSTPLMHIKYNKNIQEHEERFSMHYFLNFGIKNTWKNQLLSTTPRKPYRYQQSKVTYCKNLWNYVLWQSTLFQYFANGNVLYCWKYNARFSLQ